MSLGVWAQWCWGGAAPGLLPHLLPNNMADTPESAAASGETIESKKRTIEEVETASAAQGEPRAANGADVKGDENASKPAGGEKKHKKKRRRQYEDEAPKEKSEDEEEDDEDDDDVNDELLDLEDDDDDLAEIDTANIIAGGRRTRGKVIDFTKAAEKLKEEGKIEEEEGEDGEYAEKTKEA